MAHACVFSGDDCNSASKVGNKELCNLADIKGHFVPLEEASIVNITKDTAALTMKGPTSTIADCSTRCQTVVEVEGCEALFDYEQQLKSRRVSIPLMLWACGSAFIQGLRMDIDPVSSGIPVGF